VCQFGLSQPQQCQFLAIDTETLIFGENRLLSALAEFCRLLALWR
jgi:hypothetical protein